MARTKHAKNTDTSGGAAQGGWSNSLQGGGANLPSGWSESLQWVERIAPAPHRRHRPPERGSGQEKAFSSVKIGFSVSPPIFSLARCRLARRLQGLPASSGDRLIGLSCLRSAARGPWLVNSSRHPHFHPWNRNFTCPQSLAGINLCGNSVRVSPLVCRGGSLRLPW
jgi:hypothetical protein